MTSAAPRYAGNPAVVDGSEAIAPVEARISQGACAYPIAPSTTMAAACQAAVADGRTNRWGAPLSSSSSGRSIPEVGRGHRVHTVPAGARDRQRRLQPAGEPSVELVATQADRLANWRLLRELAGE